MSTAPFLNARASAADGRCTFATTSLSASVSASVGAIVAPAAVYALSGNDAAAPASCSTTTRAPDFTSRPTLSGASATRRSRAAVSFGTPICIRASSLTRDWRVVFGGAKGKAERRRTEDNAEGSYLLVAVNCRADQGVRDLDPTGSRSLTP